MNFRKKLKENELSKFQVIEHHKEQRQLNLKTHTIIYDDADELLIMILIYLKVKTSKFYSNEAILRKEL